MKSLPSPEYGSLQQSTQNEITPLLWVWESTAMYVKRKHSPLLHLLLLLVVVCTALHPVTITNVCAAGTCTHNQLVVRSQDRSIGGTRALLSSLLWSSRAVYSCRLATLSQSTTLTWSRLIITSSQAALSSRWLLMQSLDYSRVPVHIPIITAGAQQQPPVFGFASLRSIQLCFPTKFCLGMPVLEKC
jgi:hypothetical protein